MIEALCASEQRVSDVNRHADEALSQVQESFAHFCSSLQNYLSLNEVCTQIAEPLQHPAHIQKFTAELKQEHLLSSPNENTSLARTNAHLNAILSQVLSVQTPKIAPDMTNALAGMAEGLEHLETLLFEITRAPSSTQTTQEFLSRVHTLREIVRDNNPSTYPQLQDTISRLEEIKSALPENIARCRSAIELYIPGFANRITSLEVTQRANVIDSQYTARLNHLKALVCNPIYSAILEHVIHRDPSVLEHPPIGEIRAVQTGEFLLPSQNCSKAPPSLDSLISNSAIRNELLVALHIWIDALPASTPARLAFLQLKDEIDSRILYHEDLQDQLQQFFGIRPEESAPYLGQSGEIEAGLKLCKEHTLYQSDATRPCISAIMQTAPQLLASEELPRYLHNLEGTVRENNSQLHKLHISLFPERYLPDRLTAAMPTHNQSSLCQLSLCHDILEATFVRIGLTAPQIGATILTYGFVPNEDGEECQVTIATLINSLEKRITPAPRTQDIRRQLKTLKEHHFICDHPDHTYSLQREHNGHLAVVFEAISAEINRMKDLSAARKKLKVKQAAIKALHNTIDELSNNMSALTKIRESLSQELDDIMKNKKLERAAHCIDALEAKLLSRLRAIITLPPPSSPRFYFELPFRSFRAIRWQIQNFKTATRSTRGESFNEVLQAIYKPFLGVLFEPLASREQKALEVDMRIRTDKIRPQRNDARTELAHHSQSIALLAENLRKMDLPKSCDSTRTRALKAFSASIRNIENLPETEIVRFQNEGSQAALQPLQRELHLLSSEVATLLNTATSSLAKLQRSLPL
ncbi:MAG: hypothetical protein KDD60_02165 [Bdellovibrionales bacterium]|nr:hypothetical protein [Bdellovibrionales bacterium]